MRALVRDLLRDVLGEEEALFAAATLIGAVDGLLLQHFADPQAFPDRAALERTLVTAARRMLAP
jgi:hypothetical protein